MKRPPMGITINTPMLILVFRVLGNEKLIVDELDGVCINLLIDRPKVK